MEQIQAKQTVLLVEDDTSIRELYAMAFMRAGLNVLTAENGKEGLTMALSHHPALILLDIDMPLMNGHELFEELRTDVWGQTAKVIFLTNRDGVTDIAHANTRNPADYIVKANLPVKEVVNRVLIALGEDPLS